MKRSNAIAFSAATPTASCESSSSSSSSSSSVTAAASTISDSDSNPQPTKKQQCDENKLEGESKAAEVKIEDQVKVGQFHTRMITIPQSLNYLVDPTLNDPDVPHHLWSKAEHEKVFEDAEKVKFKILAARGNKHTEAVVSSLRIISGQSRFSWIKDDIYFKSVAEVHNYLVERAVKIEVKKYELHPWNDKRNRRVAKETGQEYETIKLKAKGELKESDVIGDEQLWKLHVEAVGEKFAIHQKLCETAALSVAEEICLSDGKFLDVLFDLVKAWDDHKGVIKDDHGNGDQVYGDGEYLSLMRKEYKLAPDGLCNYAPYGNQVERDHNGNNNSPDSYGVPAMRIGRHTNNARWRSHEEAWLCKFRTYGNPLYIGPDGHVTISQCATGRADKPKFDKGPFSGCVDAIYEARSEPCQAVKREAAITLGQLRKLVYKLKGMATKVLSLPVTSSSSPSSSSSLTLSKDKEEQEAMEIKVGNNRSLLLFDGNSPSSSSSSSSSSVSPSAPSSSLSSLLMPSSSSSSS